MRPLFLRQYEGLDDGKSERGRMSEPQHDIPGTPIFDGEMAQKAYALNKMCFSFNSAENREAFRVSEAAYCRKYGLSRPLCDAIRRRDVLALVEAGGNIYYLAKLAGIWGMGVQDIGAQQTRMSVAAFKEKLLAAGQ
jgi:protocatechuate 4,5-dioxygenase, alpha chain